MPLNKITWSNFTISIFVILVFGSLISKVEAETPRYQIEIVVFEQLTLKSWYEEIWQRDVSITPRVDMLLLKPFGSKQDDWSKLPPKHSYHARLFESKILATKSYRLISSWSWIQPVSDKSPYVKIGAEANGLTTELEGSFRLTKTRFFHIDIDLVINRVIPYDIRRTFARYHNLEEEALPERWRFKLQEKRKVKISETQYFDHPIFGALVKITKVE